jgi:hypothetical protein
MAVLVAAAAGGRDVGRMFYSSVTLLQNITQMEHKIPVLNNAFCGVRVLTTSSYRLYDRTT